MFGRPDGTGEPEGLAIAKDILIENADGGNAPRIVPGEVAPVRAQTKHRVARQRWIGERHGECHTVERQIGLDRVGGDPLIETVDLVECFPALVLGVGDAAIERRDGVRETGNLRRVGRDIRGVLADVGRVGVGLRRQVGDVGGVGVGLIGDVSDVGRIRSRLTFNGGDAALETSDVRRVGRGLALDRGDATRKIGDVGGVGIGLIGQVRDVGRVGRALAFECRRAPSRPVIRVP